MSATIALLCALGQNASLRHATPSEQAQWLAGENASKALIDASANKDRSMLMPEFGNKVMGTPQTQMAWRESEDIG